MQSVCYIIIIITLDGDNLIIYLDVLIIVNLIINYYILLLTAKINKAEYKNFKLILGAFLGALFSVYIFLPQQHIIIDILMKLFTAALTILISFRFISIKNFLRNVFIMFITSFSFAGAIFAVWAIFRPRGFIINNSVVYFDISPIFLVLFSVFFYLIITILNSILKRSAITAKNCKVNIVLKDSQATLEGIFDSGNSVKDILSNSTVIFIGKKSLEILLGKNKINDYEFQDRYRVLPCKTVTGSKLLEALRCDSAKVTFENKEIILNAPIIALSENIDEGDYSAILNPEILVNAEDRNVKK